MKLVNEGFLWQGGVDGATHFIVFMKLRVVNTKDKMLEAFEEAVEQHGWPRRFVF